MTEYPRNNSNTFDFERRPLLELQPSEFMPPVDQGNLKVLPVRFSHNADWDSSVDTTREKSICRRNSRTTVTPESQRAEPFSTVSPKSFDLRPRIPPRDYHEKVIENKIPPEMHCIPSSEPAASSNQLTQSQKRVAIIDSCQRTRNLQGSSDVRKNLYMNNTYTCFRHSAQSTPPGYSGRQKEVKKRYSLKHFQKCLSKHIKVNADIESSVHQKFCSPLSKILTATTCIAHCVSSDFAMGRLCWYPELQELRKLPINNFQPGSLNTYFDQQQQRFIYILSTKRHFFQKTNYEKLELSLQKLRQHLKRHNIQQLAILKFACGCDQLNWPTSFSILFNVFSGSKLTMTILQPTR